MGIYWYLSFLMGPYDPYVFLLILMVPNVS